MEIIKTKNYVKRESEVKDFKKVLLFLTRSVKVMIYLSKSFFSYCLC